MAQETVMPAQSGAAPVRQASALSQLRCRVAELVRVQSVRSLTTSATRQLSCDKALFFLCVFDAGADDLATADDQRECIAVLEIVVDEHPPAARHPIGAAQALLNGLEQGI